jgi:hypothetical protein
MGSRGGHGTGERCARALALDLALGFGLARREADVRAGGIVITASLFDLDGRAPAAGLLALDARGLR